MVGEEQTLGGRFGFRSTAPKKNRGRRSTWRRTNTGEIKWWNSSFKNSSSILELEF